MIIEEKGIIVSVRKFQEAGFIVKCFLESSGIVTGLYKARREKYRQEPIVGSVVYAKWQARLDEHLGIFNLESTKDITALIAHNKIAAMSLNSTLHLINLLLAEKEPSTQLFIALEGLFNSLEASTETINILSDYIKFEIYELLSLSGYGLDLSKCVVTGSIENLIYLSPRSASAVSSEIGKPYHDKLFKLPTFLLQPNQIATPSDLQEAFRLSYYFLEKHLIKPYNRIVPIARVVLQNQVSQFYEVTDSYTVNS